MKLMDRTGRPVEIEMRYFSHQEYYIESAYYMDADEMCDQDMIFWLEKRYSGELMEMAQEYWCGRNDYDGDR